MSASLTSLPAASTFRKTIRTTPRSAIASWYGDDFHGRYTANGEIFDKDAISAAHPTLPMPSYVRVTNLANAKSIIVRVNDRGPYAKGRLIDLSIKTAQLLGFYGHGIAKVRVDYVGMAPIAGSDDRKLMATLREGRPAERAGPGRVGETLRADLFRQPLDEQASRRCRRIGRIALGEGEVTAERRRRSCVTDDRPVGRAAARNGRCTRTGAGADRQRRVRRRFRPTPHPAMMAAAPAS